MRDVTPPQDRAPAEALRRLAYDRAERRAAEQRDAAHFLLEGHDAHLERGCIHAEPCSRDYFLEEELEPTLYVGTGIGALYGLGMENVSVYYDGDGVAHVIRRTFATELAGWNVRSPW